MKIEIEIGCGKGKFLVARAEAHPEIFFLGVDTAGKWMKPGMNKQEKRHLENLKFIRGDVRKLLALPIFNDNVSTFHVYFPDPWPKRRHHPRRLLSALFFKRLYQCLANGGFLHCATDHLDYHAAIQKALLEAKLPWRKKRESRNQRLFEPQLQTNFEAKYAKEGRDLYYLELGK